MHSSTQLLLSIGTTLLMASVEQKNELRADPTMIAEDKVLIRNAHESLSHGDPSSLELLEAILTLRGMTGLAQECPLPSTAFNLNLADLLALHLLLRHCYEYLYTLTPLHSHHDLQLHSLPSLGPSSVIEAEASKEGDLVTLQHTGDFMWQQISPVHGLLNAPSISIIYVGCAGESPR